MNNASRLLWWVPVLMLAASVNAASLDKAQVFDLNDVTLSQAADDVIVAKRPEKTLNQRISDRIEKSRRNREARKIMRQQREKREQERKAVDKADKKKLPNGCYAGYTQGRLKSVFQTALIVLPLSDPYTETEYDAHIDSKYR